ncbi:hypothetical protein O7602_16140 [Micromonospora sp. WMMD1128]|uniref:hypothetical protein n=1 Tax=Micromonospora sp. WMMD1128 TaxID=3015150 RepID=UPI00248B2088|nr:hypothetical protein [Micromonospora sp. WMMD1128]WBB71291.1 hypothetical protein O7602_16140 [Micromonospora sp. WMMD1128]
MPDNRFRGLGSRISRRLRAGGCTWAVGVVVRLELLLRPRGGRPGRFGPISGNLAERDLPERPLTADEHRAWLRLAAALQTNDEAG